MSGTLSKITDLDNKVFDIIWKSGREKIINDVNNGIKSNSLDEEIALCREFNPDVQQLQDVYQLYLKNRTNSNKSEVISLVNKINKRPNNNNNKKNNNI